jgi:hypothetical protein
MLIVLVIIPARDVVIEDFARPPNGRDRQPVGMVHRIHRPIDELKGKRTEGLRAEASSK